MVGSGYRWVRQLVRPEEKTARRENGPTASIEFKQLLYFYPLIVFPVAAKKKKKSNRDQQSSNAGAGVEFQPARAVGRV